MSDTTEPLPGGDKPYDFSLPVFLLVEKMEGRKYGFVLVGYKFGPAINLYSKKEFAEQAIIDLKFPKASPFQIAHPAELKRILINALEQTEASHVAIDFDPQGVRTTGRGFSIRQIIDTLENC